MRKTQLRESFQRSYQKKVNSHCIRNIYLKVFLKTALQWIFVTLKRPYENISKIFRKYRQKINAAGFFTKKLLLPQFYFQGFLQYIRNIISGPPVNVCYSFLIIDCHVSNKDLSFCSFKKKKTYKQRKTKQASKQAKKTDGLYYFPTNWNLEFA